MSADAESGGTPQDSQAQRTGQDKSISIDALADRVYRLLLRDIRTERDRGVSGSQTDRG